MRTREIFVTGTTGFIGRQLAGQLAGGAARVRCLCRQPGSMPVRDGLEVVVGDVRDPSTYAGHLRGAEIVVHLAGVTGKARPSDYMAVNVDGTRALLDACRAAGVPRIVFVSSIAATYQDVRSYPYAKSKQLAEQAVRDSGLNYLIVRPTIVLGRGSPIWTRLEGLARLPVMPIFGDGRVRVQPITVDDVVAFLAGMVDEAPLPDRAVDLGGPEILTFEDLLRRLRRSLVGKDTPVVHVPVKAIVSLLSLVEPLLLPLLPVTAGQLTAFIQESVATPDPLVAQKVPHMASIDDMIRALSARG